MPITQSASVSSRSSTASSPARMCRRSQPRSESIAAAPVTTRKRCSPRRVTVTSATMPPRSFEELRVDDAARAAVDVRVADALEQRSGARALDRDLAERGHVDQADALAQGRGLLRQHGGVGRLGPAEGALLLPRPAATAARARSSRRAPSRSWSRRPRLRPACARAARSCACGRPEHVAVERIAQAVVVAVGLARVLGRVDAGRGARRRSARGGSDCRSSSLSPAGHELGHAPCRCRPRRRSR